MSTEEQNLDGLLNDSKEEQSKETSDVQPEALPAKEEQPLSTEQISTQLKALQKGYTMSQQQLADVTRKLEERGQENAEAADNGEAYLTKKDAREIIAEVVGGLMAAPQKEQAQINQYVDTALDKLKMEGLVTDANQDELFTYAVEIDEPDLEKAARLWQREVKLRQEFSKAQVKDKQSQGSKISGTRNEGETPVIDWSKIHNTRWSDL